MKSDVVLIQCDEYDEKKISEEIKWALVQLGGLDDCFEKKDRILLKPNLLRKSNAESAIVTHPAVMSGIAADLKLLGFSNLYYGDSAGVGNMTKIAEACGLQAAMEKNNVRPADFEHSTQVEYPNGKVAKKFQLANGVLEADGIVNVCKMKTHQLEKMTGAVKNMYGCIQGFHKAKGHTIYSDALSFARMLIDLNQCIQPKLFIMDGITAMEGNGPASGTPVHMGVILVSKDPVALDSVCCALMYLNPELVPTNIYGEKMGLGTWQSENITVITRTGKCSVEEIQKEYGSPAFDVNRNKTLPPLWNWLKKLTHYFNRKPRIMQSRCVKCGICVEACPVEGKAIHQERNKVPVYDYKKCISCFCCQEMCPQKAIYVK